MHRSVLAQHQTEERATKLRPTYLLLIEHSPKVLIAGMLIEPSSTARQNIIISWLHCHFMFRKFWVRLTFQDYAKRMAYICLGGLNISMSNAK